MPSMRIRIATVGIPAWPRWVIEREDGLWWSGPDHGWVGQFPLLYAHHQFAAADFAEVVTVEEQESE